jgi:hypothetical protein
MRWGNYTISIPAYAIEQQCWQSGPKNEMSLMSLIFKLILFSKAGHYVVLFQKLVDSPINSRPSLFLIDSVHQVETSLSHALLVYLY